MNLQKIKRVYLIGIGGIGMSALARFFAQRNVVVSGYDLTETELTKQLILENISISYTDNIQHLDTEAELVIYTPAIPQSNKIFTWYKENKFPIYKRSDVLQWISESFKTITIAGTHGKTTITTLVSYLLRETGFGCNAFLGGISVNYNVNYWSSQSNTTVIEADEYDRSFLKLAPDIAVLTAMDADHLDIYGSLEEVEKAYLNYVKNIHPDGTLIAKHGINRKSEFECKNIISYSLQNNSADVYAENIVQKNGTYTFDIIAKDWSIQDLYLPIGGMHNIENTVAAITVCKQLEIDSSLIKEALKGFKGVKRRFEYIVKNEKYIYIDDYAHHPKELAALLHSAKTLFNKKRCVVAFQPHLYSRTRDFANDFAKSLMIADEVILLDIYPARELPIEGVESNIIKNNMDSNFPVTILSKEGLLAYVKNAPIELLITAGAGNIDKLVDPIKEIIESK